jgi:hypothetical protein
VGPQYLVNEIITHNCHSSIKLNARSLYFKRLDKATGKER